MPFSRAGKVSSQYLIQYLVRSCSYISKALDVYRDSPPGCGWVVTVDNYAHALVRHTCRLKLVVLWDRPWLASSHQCGIQSRKERRYVSIHLSILASNLVAGDILVNQTSRLRSFSETVQPHATYHQRTILPPHSHPPLTNTINPSLMRHMLLRRVSMPSSR